MSLQQDLPLVILADRLAVCRLAVEAHGGRRWVESDLGQGSPFSFTLPV